MPAAPRRSGLWLGLAGAAVVLAAVGIGWRLGQWQRGEVSGTQSTLERQVNDLLPLAQRGEASPAEQQRLLELLVALNRKAEASRLLEALADRQPERWSLRRLLADLRREQGDRQGAERELRQLLALHPDRIEALQLLALLQFETGRGSQAQHNVKTALARAQKPKLQPQALPLGLLLANLQQKQGQRGQAETTLMELATAFPRDPRPLLARALLQQEAGQTAAAQTTLAQARELSGPALKPQLDQLAAAWGMASLEGRPTGPASAESSPGSAEPDSAERGNP
ncbi:MAG: tetratricopeptide repeat protein [Cyanobacteriota bacterium]